MAAKDVSKPCGLTIKLEKDMLWAPHSGSNYILGYFDKISFLPIKGWLDFSPRSTAIQFKKESDASADEGEQPSPSAGESERLNPLSTYPLKLLFPTQETIENLEAQGFDYRFWMGGLPDSLYRCPCVSVILVNLTDLFKEPFCHDVCGGQLAALTQVLRDASIFQDGTDGLRPVCKEDLKKAHLCVLPSLGYTDYCILVAEEDWDLAPNLIEYLHRAVYQGSPVLSTDYVMPAYHISAKQREREDAIYSNSYQKQVRLSMRVHLRPGVPMEALKRAAESAAADGIEVSQLSGSSDCLLESRAGRNFDALLGMVMGDHAEHGNQSIRDLVITTESTLRRPVRSTGWQAADVQPVLPELKNKNIKALRKQLQIYWDLLRQDKRHMRLFSAAWERVTLIEDICSQPHNLTLRRIMDPWLEAFTDCVLREIQGIQSGKERLKDAVDQEERTDLEEQIGRLWKGLDEALESFISQVGSFLADLSRSDCFSMESERYNHASVGSATALLLAYSRWQNQFVEDVLEEEGNTSSKYAFLVRSGGCDSTNTNNIFTGLVPELEAAKDGGSQNLKENMPMITQMSEMSLFDCGGAVMRMAHECMHFCGNRYRFQRSKMIFDFTARLFGSTLAYALFSREDYPGDLLQRLKNVFQVEDKDLTQAVCKCWRREFEGLRGRIAKEIKALLEEDCQAEQPWSELEHMSESLREWMMEKLSLRFRWYSDSRAESDDENRYPDSLLATTLYREQLRAARAFYDGCDSVLRGHERLEVKTLNFCAVERRLLDKRLQYILNDGKYRDWNLRQSIVAVLSRILMDKLCDTVSDRALQGLAAYHLPTVMKDIVFSCFSEAFADMQACIRLDARLEDYLLAFTFEEWDIRQALPKSDSYVYRIGAVLNVRFPSSLNDERTALTQQTREQIKNAVDNLERHRLPHQRIDVQQLLKQIDLLLKNYRPLAWETEPLEKYLTLCQEEYIEQGCHSRMEKYQRAFRNISLLNPCSGADEVTNIFTNLVTIGRAERVEANV